MKKTLSRMVITSAVAFGVLIPSVYASNNSSGCRQANGRSEYPHASSHYVWTDATQAKLNLSEDQKKLWSEIQDKQQGMRDFRQAQWDSREGTLAQRMTQPGFNMRTFFDEQEAKRTAMQAQRTEIQALQVKFFDSLSSEQKQVLASSFGSRGGGANNPDNNGRNQGRRPAGQAPQSGAN